MHHNLRLGTRGSELALWQANHVRDTLLAAHPGLTVELEIIRTTGDRVLDVPLNRLGDQGVFTKEIEKALIANEIDVAVHSLKDLPTRAVPGLTITAITRREDPADVLISRHNRGLAAIPQGAEILTGSLRRQAQLLNLRPDLIVAGIRGNLQTRLAKLDASQAEAMILARAGLVRLGLEARITERFDPEIFLPACGQGALAIQIRTDDTATGDIVNVLNDPASAAATTAERSFLDMLGTGCQVPVGAFGRITADGRTLTVTGIVAGLDGRQLLRHELHGELTGPDAASTIGRRLAEALRQEGCQAILDEALRKQSSQRTPS